VTKPAGMVLLIIGVILGPGYYIYTRFYSGREITEQPLHFQQQADGGNRAVASIDLLPVMGPVTFMLSITASHGPTLSPPDVPRNQYRVRITFEDSTVLEQSFVLKAVQVESTPAQVFEQALPVMMVKAPGKYTLELDQEGEVGMEVKQASVEVRAGVHSLSTTLLATGIVLLAAGVFVTLI
jgi:hypothetical protein